MPLRINIAILLLFHLAFMSGCTNGKEAQQKEPVLSVEDQRCRDSITNLLQMRYGDRFSSYKSVKFTPAELKKGHFDSMLVKEQLYKLNYLLEHDLYTGTAEEEKEINQQIELLQDSLSVLRRYNYYHVTHTYCINERGCEDTIKLEVAFDTLFHPKYLVLL